jgi:hypothetical protein
LKSLEGVWKDGKPNHQMKMKLMMDIDLRAKSYNWGTGKNEGIISSINCESECGTVKARVAGMTEDQMKYVTENQNDVTETIIETQCCGLSQDRDGNWGLLHPAFKAFRDDKDTCDDLKSIQEIENMAKTLKTI